MSSIRAYRENKDETLTKIILCDECGKEFDSEETIYQIISKPDQDWHSKTLGCFCKKCFDELSRAFKKEYGEGALIEC